MTSHGGEYTFLTAAAGAMASGRCSLALHIVQQPDHVRVCGSRALRTGVGAGLEQFACERRPPMAVLAAGGKEPFLPLIRAFGKRPGPESIRVPFGPRAAFVSDMTYA